MKTLHIATVEVVTLAAIGMGRHVSTRIIPVWAEEREHVDRLVHDAIEGEEHRGGHVSVSKIDVEAAIGTPD